MSRKGKKIPVDNLISWSGCTDNVQPELVKNKIEDIYIVPPPPRRSPPPLGLSWCRTHDISCAFCNKFYASTHVAIYCVDGHKYHRAFVCARCYNDSKYFPLETEWDIRSFCERVFGLEMHQYADYHAPPFVLGSTVQYNVRRQHRYIMDTETKRTISYFTYVPKLVAVCKYITIDTTIVPKKSASEIYQQYVYLNSNYLISLERARSVSKEERTCVHCQKEYDTAREAVACAYHHLLKRLVQELSKDSKNGTGVEVISVFEHNVREGLDSGEVVHWLIDKWIETLHKVFSLLGLWSKIHSFDMANN